MSFEKGKAYNAPPGTRSDIDQNTIAGYESNQLTEHHYQRKALIEAQKEQYFTQLANVTTMPKHSGKKIKRYHYLPLLDDENINDQGIDANGVVIKGTDVQYYFTADSVTLTSAAGDSIEGTSVPVDAAANAAELVAWLNARASTVIASAGAGGVVNFIGTKITDFMSQTDSGTFEALTSVDIAELATSISGSGNLYGSSKDPGLISGKLPVVGEHGGRVNRVGFKRKQIEGTFEKFGFFDEYTAESLDFDSDEQLRMHVHREMVRAASEMSEDALQIDLLNAARTIRWVTAGASTKRGIKDVLDYSDLLHLNIELDNNRTPKQTTMITGTRYVDTRTIPGARVAYIGSELIPTFMRMTELVGTNVPAFISVEKYAAGTTTLRGEIGAVGGTRIVVVPEMMSWSGGGHTTPTTGTLSSYYNNGTNLDVFPVLIVGEGSFTTIGFQSSSMDDVKFSITHKKPGKERADRADPFGETGFMSIKWWYGFMALRPERIGLIYTAALL